MTVEDILEAKGNQVFTIGRESSVHDAIALMVDENVGSLVVADEAGLPEGIITERDILRESRDRCEAMRTTRVAQVMTRRLITAEPADEIEDVQRIMMEHRIRHLPVLYAGRLIGMVSIGDVNKVLLTEREAENSGLREYIAGGYR